MKILTLNTWQECGPWRERWEIIFAGVEKMKPDIIGFQEVFNPSWAKEIQTRTGYPTLVFPEEPGGLLILSRFPVLRSACLTLKTRSPLETYSRYVLFSELKTERGPLVVFNTHWSWQLTDSLVRQKQADEFLEFAREKAGEAASAAMGDFNSTVWTSEIRKLKEAGWEDAFAALHPQTPGFTWDNANHYAFGSNHAMPDRRIDYIFTRCAAETLERPESAQVVFSEPDAANRFASDHYGLLVTFK